MSNRYKVRTNAKPVNVAQHLEEMINDIYPPVEIAGLTFNPGEILRTLDPVAFKIMVLDEEVNMLDDGYVEINGEIYKDEDVEPYLIDLTKGTL